MEAASERLEYERAAVLRDKLKRLEALRGQFARLRFAVETLSFAYTVPGHDGDDRVYLIRRGRVRAEIDDAEVRPDDAATLAGVDRRRVHAGRARDVADSDARDRRAAAAVVVVPALSRELRAHERGGPDCSARRCIVTLAARSLRRARWRVSCTIRVLARETLRRTGNRGAAHDDFLATDDARAVHQHEAWLEYPGCDEPGGCHDLTLGKIYEMLGVEGKGSFYRIVDDSGDDFLYPVSHFKVV